MSTLLVALGFLVALGGLIWIVFEIRAHQSQPNSISSWIFRAGLLIYLAGEAVAIFAPPGIRLTYKVMLLSSAAIVFIGLTLLPYEWQSPDFTLERSLSWQVIVFGLGIYLMAIFFIQGFVMLVGALGGWLAARQVRRWAATGADRQRLLNLAFGLQIGVILLTFILLFF